MAKEYGYRYCDRCRKLLTKKNNTCGYDLCDKCNEWLEKRVGKKKLRLMEKGEI